MNYPYLCKDKKCAHRFDHEQKMNDPKPDCPKCKGEVERQIAQTSFQLLGGGWADSGYGSSG